MSHQPESEEAYPFHTMMAEGFANHIMLSGSSQHRDRRIQDFINHYNSERTAWANIFLYNLHVNPYKERKLKRGTQDLEKALKEFKQTFVWWD